MLIFDIFQYLFDYQIVMSKFCACFNLFQIHYKAYCALKHCLSNRFLTKQHKMLKSGVINRYVLFVEALK
jgi:hypothetical protein